MTMSANLPYLRENNMPTVARTEKLDLRLTLAAKRVLQSAATAAKRSVSEFVLESALARAEETFGGSACIGADIGGPYVGPAPTGRNEWDDTREVGATSRRIVRYTGGARGARARGARHLEKKST
ncbi:MAG: DUF1778 domain-containing protein [Vicinamibacterales bacterium]